MNDFLSFFFMSSILFQCQNKRSEGIRLQHPLLHPMPFSIKKDENVRLGELGDGSRIFAPYNVSSLILGTSFILFTDATPVPKTNHSINVLKNKMNVELMLTTSASSFRIAGLAIQSQVSSLNRSIQLDICLVSSYSLMHILGSTRHLCLGSKRR